MKPYKITPKEHWGFRWAIDLVIDEEEITAYGKTIKDAAYAAGWTSGRRYEKSLVKFQGTAQIMKTDAPDCDRCHKMITYEPWKITYPGRNQAFSKICFDCWTEWKALMKEWLKSK